MLLPKGLDVSFLVDLLASDSLVLFSVFSGFSSVNSTSFSNLLEVLVALVSLFSLSCCSSWWCSSFSLFLLIVFRLLAVVLLVLDYIAVLIDQPPFLLKSIHFWCSCRLFLFIPLSLALFLSFVFLLSLVYVLDVKSNILVGHAPVNYSMCSTLEGNHAEFVAI